MPRTRGVWFGISGVHRILTAVTYGLVVLCCAAAFPSKLVSETRRHVSVSDGVKMTRLAWAGRGTLRETATFSPDRSRFFVLLEKGNLENNTVEYSLLLWRTAEVFRTPRADVLATFASSSNRAAIHDARWLDNQTLAFLTESHGEESQLYTLDVSTHKLTKLTAHATSLDSYAISTKSGAIVFAADAPSISLLTEQARREGIHVSNQEMTELVLGLEENYGKELYLTHAHSAKVSRLNAENLYSTNLTMSPDGRYVLAQSPVSELPDSWAEYDFPFLQELIRSKQYKRAPGFPADRIRYAPISRYSIIDTTTGEVKTLLNGPIGSMGSEAAWAPDGRSVVLSDVFLPLDVKDPVERKARESTAFSVEIKVPGGELVKISNKNLWLVGWDRKTDLLEFALGRLGFLLGKSQARVFFVKAGATWQEIKLDEPSNQPQIIVEENSNLPPRLIAIDSKTGQRALLMDPNPQFKQLALAAVEQVQWKSTNGHQVRGGLILPPDYVPGKRYPLVIQPYGFTPDQFWIEGPWQTAFAAQALAGKGFVVLEAQWWDSVDSETPVRDSDTPKEGPGVIASYEGAVDYLDSRGIIDRNLVGLVGFSHTCFHVKYALTHSQYHFAAAVVADGVDGGYFQYITYLHNPPALDFAEGVNGGSPFGSGLASWLKLSPGFNLDKVTAPVLMQAIGRGVPSEWEWFSGLSRLGKAVDMIYLPFGSHTLVKPWEQLTSQQATVDWFTFWLKGEEDPDPAKADQYARWRELRKLQEESQKANSQDTSP